MTKTQLIAPNAPKALQLRQLAKEINSAHKTVEFGIINVRDKIRSCVAEAALGGKSLIAAKALLKKGDWKPWLVTNCPTITQDKANRYMIIARGWDGLPEVREAQNMRAALALCCGEVPEAGKGDRQEWPAWTEAAKRFDKAKKFFVAHPITDWPEEGRNQLREDLAPVAAALWPERFQ